MLGPNIADRIAALVGRPFDRVVWARLSFIERNGRKRLEGMAQNIKAREGSDTLGHMF